MLKEIEGQWSLDDNGNVTYQRIVEVPEMKKDDIYNRVLNYFIYNYGSGKSVIQTQDKEAGLIVGKGLYEEVHVGIFQKHLYSFISFFIVAIMILTQIYQIVLDILNTNIRK